MGTPRRSTLVSYFSRCSDSERRAFLFAAQRRSEVGRASGSSVAGPGGFPFDETDLLLVRRSPPDRGSLPLPDPPIIDVNRARGYGFAQGWMYKTAMLPVMNDAGAVSVT
jgi:hypothetical protein